MNKSQTERNAAIVRQYQSGWRQSYIARHFKISPHRVRQLIKTDERHKKHRAELEKKYGPHPNIAALSDATPIEVLLLCDGKIAGWAVRIGHLERPLSPSSRPAIKTLGDLRSTSDTELLREPNVGRKMLAELRRFCPPKTDETLERLFAKIRTLPSHRKVLAIDALTKICEPT